MLSVVVSLLLGGILTVCIYFIVVSHSFRHRNSTTYAVKDKSTDYVDSSTEAEKQFKYVINDAEKVHLGGKRQEKNKKRRLIQREFTHPWLIGTLKGHTDSVLDMDLSGNGKFLASCAEDRTVLIWCTKDLLCKDRKSLRINVEYDHANFVRWSPDGKAFIINKVLANSIEVYKVSKKADGSLGSAFKSSEFPKHHLEDVVAMDIACNGRFIVTCSKKNDLVIWNLKGQILCTIDTLMGSTYQVRISPCGRFVAASGFTPDVKIWEVIFTKSGEFKQIAKAFVLGGHTSGVTDFSFNSDSSRMATISKDGTYQFYNTKVEFEKGEDSHLILRNQCKESSLSSIALSPNAEIVAISHASSLSFYSTVNGKLDTIIMDIFCGPIKCLRFDSLGEYILVAGDKHIKIFRNVPGYRASIETARTKLSKKQTSATKERLEKTVADCEKYLKEIHERCS